MFKEWVQTSSIHLIHACPSFFFFVFPPFFLFSHRLLYFLTFLFRRMNEPKDKGRHFPFQSNKGKSKIRLCFCLCSPFSISPPIGEMETSLKKRQLVFSVLLSCQWCVCCLAYPVFPFFIPLLFSLLPDWGRKNDPFYMSSIFGSGFLTHTPFLTSPSPFILSRLLSSRRYYSWGSLQWL